MTRFFVRNFLGTTLGVLMVSGAAGAYYPSMVRHAKETLAPGVTLQRLTNGSPNFVARVLEIDMTNRNVELVPVFKAAGNVALSSNERTSSMAARSHALAAVNGGFYSVNNEIEGRLMTNSYTMIDSQFIGGRRHFMTPEQGRSVLGFSGDYQTFPIRTKMSSSTGAPIDPTDAANWPRIAQAMGGRGSFTSSNGVATVDNEGVATSAANARRSRTAIGYSMNPYRAYLVTVDEGISASSGLSYLQLGRLMADLGIEQSINLDGGGSTTMWVDGRGVINNTSDGSERAVVSAWAVLQATTVDNTAPEATSTGTWITQVTDSTEFHINSQVANASGISGNATFTWQAALSTPGVYKVYARWVAGTGRAAQAPYEVTHANGITTTTVDQRTNGGQWNLLGVYAFDGTTPGEVTLRNTATGNVSADAVRFLRIADFPAPVSTDYKVISTLYETDFETNRSADFTLAQQVANGNNSINFTYDYSNFSQAGGGLPTAIPPSPGSTGPGTRALRMAANTSAGVINAITATLNTVPAQTNLRITFDAWQNYNGGAGGAAGSTQFANFGGSANSALVAAASSSYTSTANSPFNGFYFAIAPEGGSIGDYRYYDGTGGNARGNNASRANYLGTTATEPSDFTHIFPSEQFETPGATGKQWVQWEVLVLDGRIRLTATAPGNRRYVLCDWFTPNTGTPLNAFQMHLGVMDNYASSGSPASDVFVLYDNLKVEKIASNASVSDWSIY